MLRHRICLTILFATNLVAEPLSSSRASVKNVLEELSKTVQFGESRISPDGQRVAWTEKIRNPDGSESRASAIYVAPLATPAKAIRVTAGDGRTNYSESDLAWSPDSRTLLFLSDCDEAKQPQLYSLDITRTASKPKKLTSLKGEISNPQFSPDGSRIAFLFLEGAKAVGPLDAYTPELGVLHADIHEQRVAVLNMADGSVKTVSPADLFVYEFDWSPDNNEIAYTAAHGDGDNNWWIAKLYRLNVTTGKQELVCSPEAQIADPRWSPDGQSIAYIGGLMSDQGVTGGDIYMVSAHGGEPENVTAHAKSSANWVRWVPGKSRKLLVGELVDGGMAISEMNLTTKTTERLWKGDEQLQFGEVAQDGHTVAAVRSSWAQPPEIWAGKLGTWTAVTGKNENRRPQWGKSEKLHWEKDGRRVEGWLLYPADFDASKRYPMVVSIHGGPASQKSPAWPQSDYSILASQGMFVFFPNPRGSYGQGEAFTRANVKDFGYGDLADILAGVDEVLRRAPVDPERLGVGGWSYGGFMTMWTVTQTQRFKAAVAGAGIANWQSYYGQNLIDQWMIPYFGASVYDDPAVYARSSPINYVKQVKTPTLIVVGERDAECPMPQSREFWHALRTLGVKTELVVYPNEGHHFRDPAHIVDLNEREVNWFRENLK